tara:strand:+ start:37 stop:432 length:396 start_codon:yes stop_codon:yes gene_type:complete
MSNSIQVNEITIEDITYTNGPIRLNGEITLTINGQKETYTIQDGTPTLKATETKLTAEELKKPVETDTRKAVSHSRYVARQATININNVVEGLKQMFQQGQPQESKKISLDFSNLTSKQLAERLDTIFNPQ